MLVQNFKTPFYRAVFSITLILLFSNCTRERYEPDSQSSGNLTFEGKSNQAAQQNTFYGPQVKMGEGKARSFITLTHTGVPIELGVEMADGALNGLPEDHEGADFTLPLHHKAQDATPFDHIIINWNHHGHVPSPLFGVPHFDFHFYTISPEERMAIPAYVPTGSPHDILPPPPYRPAGYVPTPGGEPQMGKHWIDIINPVVPGSFTYTMIYGSYNGKMIFTEPMITRAFLLSGTDISMLYGQPTLFGETGTYYPTRYNIRDDASGKRYVTLSQFVLR